MLAAHCFRLVGKDTGASDKRKEEAEKSISTPRVSLGRDHDYQG